MGGKAKALAGKQLIKSIPSAIVTIAILLIEWMYRDEMDEYFRSLLTATVSPSSLIVPSDSNSTSGLTFSLHDGRRNNRGNQGLCVLVYLIL